MGHFPPFCLFFFFFWGPLGRRQPFLSVLVSSGWCTLPIRLGLSPLCLGQGLFYLWEVKIRLRERTEGEDRSEWRVSDSSQGQDSWGVRCRLATVRPCSFTWRVLGRLESLWAHSLSLFVPPPHPCFPLDHHVPSLSFHDCCPSRGTTWSRNLIQNLQRNKSYWFCLDMFCPPASLIVTMTDLEEWRGLVGFLDLRLPGEHCPRRKKS